MTPLLSAADFASGFLALALSVCGLTILAISSRRRLLPELSGSSARVAELILASSVFFAVCELLGLAGQLSRSVLVVVLSALGATAILWWNASLRRPTTSTSVSSPWLSIVLAFASV